MLNAKAPMCGFYFYRDCSLDFQFYPFRIPPLRYEQQIIVHSKPLRLIDYAQIYIYVYWKHKLHLFKSAMLVERAQSDSTIIFP